MDTTQVTIIINPKNNNMWSGGTGNNKRTWQDCANYVSQCLAAGGAEQIESGWLLPHQKQRIGITVIQSLLTHGAARPTSLTIGRIGSG